MNGEAAGVPEDAPKEKAGVVVPGVGAVPNPAKGSVGVVAPLFNPLNKPPEDGCPNPELTRARAGAADDDAPKIFDDEGCAGAPKVNGAGEAGVDEAGAAKVELPNENGAGVAETAAAGAEKLNTPPGAGDAAGDGEAEPNPPNSDADVAAAGKREVGAADDDPKTPTLSFTPLLLASPPNPPNVGVLLPLPNVIPPAVDPKLNPVEGLAIAVEGAE